MQSLRLPGQDGASCGRRQGTWIVSRRSRRIRIGKPDPHRSPVHLSLADQYDFTNGNCSIFAFGAQEMLGGELTMLICADKRQFEQHDWPEDVPLCLHVFLTMPDGSCVDAEGRRSLPDLLRAFGVKRGWKSRVVAATRQDVETHFRGLENCGDEIEAVAELLREHGWHQTIPECDDALDRNYEQARQESYDRHMARKASPAAAP